MEKPQSPGYDAISIGTESDQPIATSMKLHTNRQTILDQIAILTIGLPFGAFKLLLGMVFLKLLPSPCNDAIGYTLIALGCIDIFINFLNLFALLLQDRSITEVCVLTMILARLKRNSRQNEAWKDFGTALDVMLSFTLVAVMVAGNMSHYLSGPALTLWNYSVVVNVLGAGLSRILISLRQVRYDAEPVG
jgi:hypothetical protein